MSIRARCSHCGESYVLDDAMVGKKAKCKSCQNIFRIQPADPAPTKARSPNPPVPTPVAAKASGSKQPVPSAPVRKNLAPRPPTPALSGDDDSIHDLQESDEIGLPAYQRQEAVAAQEESRGESIWETVRPGSKLGRREWKKARQGYLMMGIPAAVFVGFYLAPFPYPFMLVFWVLIAGAAASMFGGAAIAISVSRDVQAELVKSIVLGVLVCMISLYMLFVSASLTRFIVRIHGFAPRGYSSQFNPGILFRVHWFHGPISSRLYLTVPNLRGRDLPNN